MDIVYLVSIVIGSVFAVPICLILLRYLLQSLLKISKGYGQALGLLGSTYGEDFINSNPKCNIVSTLELDGDITVYKIRKLFQELVLNAKLPGSHNQLRFPEFRQHILTVFGFQVWKDVENFEISEHIIEEKAEKEVLDLGNLHQTLMNKRFRGNLSPWEIILYRNVHPVDEDDIKVVEGSKPKTLLAFRIHHSVCDAKSIIKLFVECLGQKPLHIAETHALPTSLTQRLLFQVLYPFNFVKEAIHLLLLTWRHLTHPWRLNPSDDGKLLVKFSKPLNIKHLKRVADENGVTMSTILLSLIGGTIHTFHKKLPQRGTAVGYVVPKNNHPDFLTNHYSAVVDHLPITAESEPSSQYERLRRYESIFKRMKNPARHPFYEYAVKFFALMPKCHLRHVLEHSLRVTFGTVGITNIAGERDGFSIGDVWCSGFRMSGSLPKTSIGVLFIMVSYQKDLRIAVVGYDCIISEEETAKVANLIGLQYDKLEVQNVQ